ncbi:MAG: class I mannose-6-phosphate isomerase [Verrucomicrobia bacterium]|nr:class I mannose-6-phosphate isomerase [Verrucomicrobiota bacterium]
MSVVAHGAYAGRDLRWLMENFQSELLGSSKAQGDRFPLLVKILDAQDKLSLQVHPPASKARQLGGEPKTEMWFMTHTTPDADLYAGLIQGMTRSEFEARIKDGTVAGCFHRLAVKAGDAMFLPSGRVHAIGAGNVIFEIQQNSDTTYRVFDWHRTGLDGKPRELHIQQSLESIDFEDFEPGLMARDASQSLIDGAQCLLQDPLFEIHDVRWDGPHQCDYSSAGKAAVIGVYSGCLQLSSTHHPTSLHPGEFALIPAALNTLKLESSDSAEFLIAIPH